jgi:ribosome biogenesis SPOUT family RNA methylase Rps3
MNSNTFSQEPLLPSLLVRILLSMKKQPVLVIEHCESVLSEWLLLEYKNVAKLWNGHLVFTRVTKKKTAQVLQKLGWIEKSKAKDIYSKMRCIILDPQAKKPLSPTDCQTFDVIIIGGLLGYEKPHGRTKKMITDKTNFETRHLGKLQLSIDGAVFVTRAICLGMNLKDIEIASEIEIIHDSIHSTILPFGYPVIDNIPIITPGLVEYLAKV